MTKSTTTLRCACLGVLFFAVSATAGPTVRPLFSQFGIEQGLPSSYVNQVAQDRAGYLWIATADGLARYDGVGFTTVRRGLDGGQELAGTAVETVFVDSRDRLWIGTEGGGLAVLDAGRRKLRRVGLGALPHPLLEADVWALGEDREGRIWVGAYDAGIHRVDPESLVVSGVRHDPADPRSPASNHVLAIAGTDDGWVWAGTTAGLDVIDARGKPGTPAVSKHLLAGEIVISLTIEPDGSVLAGGRGKIWRISRNPGGPGTPELLSIAALLPTALVQGMVRDDVDALWVLTRQHGALRIARDGRVQIVSAQPGLPLALPTRELLSGLRDRENNLWIATNGSGLQQIRAGWRNFTLLRDQAADARAAEAGQWTGASRCPNGDTWLLRRHGPLLRLDGKTDLVITERDEATGFAAWPAQAFTALECDRAGALWLGTRDGVVRFDPHSQALRAWLPRRGYEPLQGNVELIWADLDGAVWAAAQGAGLTRFDGKDGAPQKFAGGSHGLRVVETEQIGRAPDGSLWVAGDGGIDRLAAGTNDFTPMSGVPAGIVHAFAFAPDGSVWLHSREGLLHARVAAAALTSIAQYGPQQGLERMEIGALICDATGSVWLLGGRGVRRLDPRSGRWRRYGAGDGLGIGEMSLRPAQTHADGTTLALSTLGAIAFNPLEVAENRFAPGLHTQAITIDRDAGMLALPAVDSFRLVHDDRDLTVRVRALSLVDPAANRYRFRLEPFDGGWHDAGADGSRVFSSLPAGDYGLLAQGSNNSGVWSQPLSLRFTVQSPPWRSPAALLLYSVAAALLMFLLVMQQRWRWQRRHALALNEARREAAERANQAKSDFLADVAHEIRTPISGMSGMLDLLSRTSLVPRQHRYVMRIRSAIDMLLQLINNLLDLARIESGRLEIAPVSIDVCALLQELIEVESPVAAAKGVTLEIDCDASLPGRVLTDPLRLRQVLLNLLGNALKFTEHGEVRLSADAPSPNWIRLRVSDTGPGMSAEALARLFTRFVQADGSVSQRHGGSGLGLVIVRQLVDLMQGRLSVASTLGVGSTFTVELPLQESHAELADLALPGSVGVDAHFADPGPARNVAMSLERAAQTLAPIKGTDPLRLLLVEDDAILAEALMGLLQRDGFAAQHAANGLAALTQLDCGRFDVALIDFDLPGLSGLELTRLLRARGSKLPIIGISARADAAADGDAFAAGMSLFLRKPIDTLQLREALAASVAAR